MKRGKMKKLFLTAILIGVLLFGFSGAKTVYAQPASASFELTSYALFYFNLGIVAMYNDDICGAADYIWWALQFAVGAEYYAWGAYLSYPSSFSYAAWEYINLMYQLFAYASAYADAACFGPDWTYIYEALYYGAIAAGLGSYGNFLMGLLAGVGAW